MHHSQTCRKDICQANKLFIDELSVGTCTINNYEERFKYCSEFLIYLKKNLTVQRVIPSCLESLSTSFINQIKIYSEMTQFCQKFIQMIGLISKINPEFTLQGLKIFYSDVRKHIEQGRCHDLYQLRTFSMVLEGVKKMNDVIEDDKKSLFCFFVDMLSDDLLTGSTVVKKQTLYYVLKIVLQLLQSREKEGLTCFIEPEMFTECLTISMAVLKLEDCTKDSQLIASSIVMELLKLYEDDLIWLEMVHACLHYLLGGLSLNGSSKLRMGVLVLCGALLTHSSIERLTISLADLYANRSGQSGSVIELAGFRTIPSTDIFDFKVYFDSLASVAMSEFEAVKEKGLHHFVFEVGASSCKSTPNLHYQGLKLLHQWCQLLPLACNHLKMSSLTSTKDTLMCLILMHVESQVDGVDRNAIDLLSSLLEALDKISSTHPEFQDEFVAFKSSFSGRMMSFSWNMKSKYLLLGPLLGHVSIDQELDGLMSDLRRCLSTNHLVPCSTVIYKKIISSFKSNPTSCLKVWSISCCPHLIEALTSPKSLERKNAAYYWLTHTLQIIPESLKSMIFYLDYMEGSSMSSSSSPPSELFEIFDHMTELLNKDVSPPLMVYARLRILWAARMAALSYEFPLENLKFAFSASSNDLRLAALNLICISPSTTDCPSEDDASLLKEFMAHQLSVDDPAFRKELEKCLRSLCVRCRDHSLLQLRILRKKKTGGKGDFADEGAKNVRICIDLINFLWRTCVDNLTPNSNFQRLNSSLTWMKIILGTFISTPHLHIRKGIVPAEVELFLEAAREGEMCDFFSQSCATSLLCCIFNDVEQICEMASEILQHYFPWPLKCEKLITLEEKMKGWRKKGITSFHEKATNSCNNVESNNVDVNVWLLRESLDLCNNFRSRETSCGVVLGGLIFSRYILEHPKSIGLSRSDLGIIVSKHSGTTPPMSKMSHGISFLEQIFNLVVDDFNKAVLNIVDRASVLPLHGVISLLTVCMKRLPLVEPEDGEGARRMKDLLQRIINFCKNLVDSIFDIFGERLISEVTSPSFEQISRAISELVSASRKSCDGRKDLKDEDVARLHQFVTSWCWLNIKGSGLLLGEIMRYCERSSIPMVDVEGVQQVGQVFFKVLTQCRHRGAIESCTLGLMDFCSSSFHSADKFIFDLPSGLVNQVFDQLGALSDSSTTRRSAGLPSIIQAVLISEARCGQSTILKKVVGKLWEISTTGEKDFHQQRDHPQVHAMNILKTLVHESCLSDSMSQFLEPIVLSIVDGFNSDNWMVRNAALQLFGSMVPRMLGEKTSSDETIHSTNSSEFLLRFPKFIQSVLEILTTETKNMKASLTNFVDFCDNCPNDNRFDQPSAKEANSFSHSLVPILSLLSRLAPSYHLIKQRSNQEIVLCRLVQNLCQGSVLTVRELSAKVLLTLVHKENLYDLIVSMLTLLPDGVNNNHISTNHLHGLLLQLLKLYLPASECLSDEQMACVKNLLEAKAYLYSNSCLLIRTCYLKVMFLWYPHSKPFLETAERLFTKHSFDDREIGSAYYQRILVNVWLSESRDKCLSANQISFCLKSNSNEVVLSCLDWIVNCEERIPDESKNDIADILWALLKNHSNLSWQVLCSCLKASLSLNKPTATLLDSFHERWNVLAKICKITIHDDDNEEICKSGSDSAKSYTPARLSLELSSQILSGVLKLLPRAEMMEKIKSWSLMILWCSRCTKNVDLRGSAVRSCIQVAPSCFEIFTGHLNHHVICDDWKIILIRLLEAGLKFLIDDDVDIRLSAAEMVSLISRFEYSKVLEVPSSVHHEIAIEMLLDKILDLAGTNCSAIIKFLFSLVEDDESFSRLNYFQTTGCKLDELFLAEEDNPYFESDQFHQIVSNCLIKKVSVLCIELGFVKEKVNSLSIKINMMMNVVSHLMNRSLEFVFNKNLCTCLSSLYWQHLLLTNVLDNTDDCEELKPIKDQFLDERMKFLMQFHTKNL